MDSKPSDLVEMILKMDEPPEPSTTVRVADPGEMPPEEATQVGQFQIGVEARDRIYLKSEAIFLPRRIPDKWGFGFSQIILIMTFTLTPWGGPAFRKPPALFSPPVSGSPPRESSRSLIFLFIPYLSQDRTSPQG